MRSFDVLAQNSRGVEGHSRICPLFDGQLEIRAVGFGSHRTVVQLIEAHLDLMDETSQIFIFIRLAMIL